MATSSGILHSFLEEALQSNKNYDQLFFKDFLEYSRSGCGLIELDIDPSKIKSIDENEELLELLKENNAVILFEDQLYYADKMNKKVRKLEPNDTNKPQYNELKKKISKTYKQAKGYDLDLVMSVTERAFSEHRSNDFLSSLNFYLDLLDNTNQAMFAFMTENQKEQQRYNLTIALMLLLAQQQHEMDYQKTENKKAYAAKIARCMRLLDALNPISQKQIGLALEQQETTDGKPVKYLGMSLGQELGEQLSQWKERPTKNLKELMGSLNDKRLYWVWGSAFLKTMIDLIPPDVYGAQNAPEAIRTLDPYAGNLSWALYYFRFSVHLFLLLKHTIKGPLMSEEEAKMPWYERFQTQWDQRKFNLLNDSLWGTSNLITFFWLTGKGTMGAWGDLITVVLLVFDISVAIWDYEEQKTQFNKQMLEYEKDIKRLKNQLERLKKLELADAEEKKANALKVHQLNMELHNLEIAKIKCEKNWEIQKLSLINNIAYAVGLMLAFFVLAMPFIPIAAPVAVIVGAVLCTAFTVINNTIKGGLELYKTDVLIREISAKEKQKMIELRKDLLKENKLDENERKLLYLEIKQLEAEKEYQIRTFQYQSAGLVRNIMLQVLTPAIILSTLIFLPMIAVLPPAALFFIGAGIVFALAVASHFFVEKVFKVSNKKEAEFNETEYENYCDKLKTENNDNQYTFFKDSKDKLDLNEGGIEYNPEVI